MGQKSGNGAICGVDRLSSGFFCSRYICYDVMMLFDGSLSFDDPILDPKVADL